MMRFVFLLTLLCCARGKVSAEWNDPHYKSVDNEGIDAETAKDMLLKYSLKQKEADQEAMQRYGYCGAYLGYPLVSLKDKQHQATQQSLSRSEISTLLGYKFYRFAIEFASFLLKFPTYNFEGFSKKTTVGFSLDGMFFAIDKYAFQLFGLASFAKGFEENMVPKLGVGIFWGGYMFGLTSKVTFDLIPWGKTSSEKAWSRSIGLHLGFRYIFQF